MFRKDLWKNAKLSPLVEDPKPKNYPNENVLCKVTSTPLRSKEEASWVGYVMNSSVDSHKNQLSLRKFHLDLQSRTFTANGR